MSTKQIRTNRCVILVDDDESVQVAMGERLAFTGYKPLVFVSVDELQKLLDG